MSGGECQVGGRGLESEDLKGPCGLRGCPERRGARRALRGRRDRPNSEENGRKNAVITQMTGRATLRSLMLGAYNLLMKGVDDQAAPTTLPPKADVPAPVAD